MIITNPNPINNKNINKNYIGAFQKTKSQMEYFDNFIAATKNNIMKKMLNYTDPEYYLIKYKPVLETDEAKFV